MSKKKSLRKVAPVVLRAILAIFISIPTSFAYEGRFEANLQIEVDFKSICKTILDLLSEDLSDSTWNEKIIRYRWKLKSLAERHPESVWADDAQYIFSVLGASEGLLVPEFEYLLAHFPNSEVEPWTRQMFDFMIPDESPLDFVVRKHLCVNYADLKKKRRLERLVKTSMELYPSRAESFQIFLDEFEQENKNKKSKNFFSSIKTFSAPAEDRSSFPIKAERG